MAPVTGHSANRVKDEQENVPLVRREPKGKERARDERKDVPVPESEMEMI